ncbi:GNAT family N-acetyltransferase [Halobacterium litoreum]|uniref:GNAT family N-acetyltransferase n=1 Tax=Halobacterium litoreum TaxID=2039234 RepID=A0ABD5NCS6_9EURY|nr:GNAT family protein [Halobacterium litoreum]UHH14049.1 GNAT family N-acetyltransferase [Halobacterium litoreum]
MLGDDDAADVFPETLTTPRLRLERCSRDNVTVREFYRAASRNSPNIEDVTEHLTWSPHESPKESRDTLIHFEEQWDEGDVATYAIRLREDEAERLGENPDALAGTCGLTCHWEQDCAVLGVWLREAYWGNGYSGERADALLELAFDGLDFGVVAVTHHADNAKSEAAIEKYVAANGGRREGLLRHHGDSPDGPVDEVRYTISASEWRDANDRA